MKTGNLLTILGIMFFLTSCSSSMHFMKETQPPLTLAILNFEANGISRADAQKITVAVKSEVSSIIKKRGIHYNVIGSRKINKIMKEYDIQSKGTVSQDAAIDLGKIIQVDRILIGSVGLVGLTYSIDARIVDVETSAIVNSSERHQKCSFDKMKTTLVPKLVKNLFQKRLFSAAELTEKIDDIQRKRVNTLAVLDLEAIGVTDIEAKVLSGKLRSTISQEINKKDKNYLLIERARMNEIINLNQFKNASTVSEKSVVEFGKMLQVDRIVIGSVGRDDNTITINVSIVDVESSNVINKVNRQHKGSIDRFMVSVIPKAGRELLKVY